MIVKNKIKILKIQYQKEANFLHIKNVARPCQRCIKRDLATTCTDAARKRAKYLQDLPVEETIFNNSTEPSSFSDSILNTTSMGRTM